MPPEGWHTPPRQAPGIMPGEPPWRAAVRCQTDDTIARKAMIGSTHRARSNLVRGSRTSDSGKGRGSLPSRTIPIPTLMLHSSWCSRPGSSPSRTGRARDPASRVAAFTRSGGLDRDRTNHIRTNHIRAPWRHDRQMNPSITVNHRPLIGFRSDPPHQSMRCHWSGYRIARLIQPSGKSRHPLVHRDDHHCSLEATRSTALLPYR